MELHRDNIHYTPEFELMLSKFDKMSLNKSNGNGEPPAKIPKVQTSLLKIATKKNTLSKNPTIDSLRNATEQQDPDTLYNLYVPCMFKRPQKIAKTPFKRTLNLVTNNQQIFMYSTDAPSMITGEEHTHLQKSKNVHAPKWTLNQTLLNIGHRAISTAEENEIKSISMDIPAFLHTFSQIDDLKARITEISEELAATWNEANSAPDKAKMRKENEMSIFLDYRSGKNAKPLTNSTELHLTGTTWNFTIAKQHESKKVVCEPKDCFFQLRFISYDGTPIRGQTSLARDDWLGILDSQNFQDFYKENWNFLPLPLDYCTPRIEEYNIAKNGPVEGVDDRDICH